MPDRKHRPRPPEAADQTHRLSDPRRGAADRRISAPTGSASGAIGAPPRRTSPTLRRSCRSAPPSNWWKRTWRRSPRRSPIFRGATAIRDGGPQQPAAGRAADLRLQDRGTARRDATPPRAAGAAAPARPGRRIRRCGRNARLARQRRPQGASRHDEGARSRPARHRLAHGARPHRRGRLLSGTAHRHAGQDFHGREASDETEVAEVYEPFHEARRSSSTMPQKRNPISCLYIHSTVALVRQHVAALLEAAVADHERSTGPGRSNGSRCRKSFCWRRARWRRPGSGLGPRGRADRMRANLDLTRGMIVSEAVMMGLGPHLGRQRAHDLVYDICRKVSATGVPLVSCWRRMPKSPSISRARSSTRCAIPQTISASPARWWTRCWRGKPRSVG